MCMRLATLGEEKSTMTVFAAPSGPAPDCGTPASGLSTCARNSAHSHASSSVMFRKPGPATSTRSCPAASRAISAGAAAISS